MKQEKDTTIMIPVESKPILDEMAEFVTELTREERDALLEFIRGARFTMNILRNAG